MLGGMNPSTRSIGTELCLGFFSFGPNGTSNPVITGTASTLSGGLARWVQSITYSAIGVQTIVFAEGFGFAGATIFTAIPQVASLADHFIVAPVGAYNPTTRTLVLQQHRNGTGQPVPAAAGARIHVVVLAHNSSAP